MVGVVDKTDASFPKEEGSFPKDEGSLPNAELGPKLGDLLLANVPTPLRTGERNFGVNPSCNGQKSRRRNSKARIPSSIGDVGFEDIVQHMKSQENVNTESTAERPEAIAARGATERNAKPLLHSSQLDVNPKRDGRRNSKARLPSVVGDVGFDELIEHMKKNSFELDANISQCQSNANQNGHISTTLHAGPARVEIDFNLDSTPFDDVKMKLVKQGCTNYIGKQVQEIKSEKATERPMERHSDRQTGKLNDAQKTAEKSADIRRQKTGFLPKISPYGATPSFAEVAGRKSSKTLRGDTMAYGMGNTIRDGDTMRDGNSTMGKTERIENEFCSLPDLLDLSGKKARNKEIIANLHGPCYGGVGNSVCGKDSVMGRSGGISGCVGRDGIGRNGVGRDGLTRTQRNQQQTLIPLNKLYSSVYGIGKHSINTKLQSGKYSGSTIDPAVLGGGFPLHGVMGIQDMGIQDTNHGIRSGAKQSDTHNSFHSGNHSGNNNSSKTGCNIIPRSHLQRLNHQNPGLYKDMSHTILLSQVEVAATQMALRKEAKQREVEKLTLPAIVEPAARIDPDGWPSVADSESTARFESTRESADDSSRNNFNKSGGFGKSSSLNKSTNAMSKSTPSLNQSRGKTNGFQKKSNGVHDNSKKPQSKANKSLNVPVSPVSPPFKSSNMRSTNIVRSPTRSVVTKATHHHDHHFTKSPGRSEFIVNSNSGTMVKSPSRLENLSQRGYHEQMYLEKLKHFLNASTSCYLGELAKPSGPWKNWHASRMRTRSVSQSHTQSSSSENKIPNSSYIESRNANSVLNSMSHSMDKTPNAAINSMDKSPGAIVQNKPKKSLMDQNRTPNMKLDCDYHHGGAQNPMVKSYDDVDQAQRSFSSINNGRSPAKKSLTRKMNEMTPTNFNSAIRMKQKSSQMLEKPFERFNHQQFMSPSAQKNVELQQVRNLISQVTAKDRENEYYSVGSQPSNTYATLTESISYTTPADSNSVFVAYTTPAETNSHTTPCSQSYTTPCSYVCTVPSSNSFTTPSSDTYAAGPSVRFDQNHNSRNSGSDVRDGNLTSCGSVVFPHTSVSDSNFEPQQQTQIPASKSFINTSQLSAIEIVKDQGPTPSPTEFNAADLIVTSKAPLPSGDQIVNPLGQRDEAGEQSGSQAISGTAGDESRFRATREQNFQQTTEQNAVFAGTEQSIVTIKNLPYSDTRCDGMGRTQNLGDLEIQTPALITPMAASPSDGWHNSTDSFTSAFSQSENCSIYPDQMSKVSQDLTNMTSELHSLKNSNPSLKIASNGTEPNIFSNSAELNLPSSTIESEIVSSTSEPFRKVNIMRTSLKEDIKKKVSIAVGSSSEENSDADNDSDKKNATKILRRGTKFVVGTSSYNTLLEGTPNRIDNAEILNFESPPNFFTRSVRRGTVMPSDFNLSTQIETSREMEISEEVSGQITHKTAAFDNSMGHDSIGIGATNAVIRTTTNQNSRNENIESTIEKDITENIESTIEKDITENIENTIEKNITENIESTSEKNITENIQSTSEKDERRETIPIDPIETIPVVDSPLSLRAINALVSSYERKTGDFPVLRTGGPPVMKVENSERQSISKPKLFSLTPDCDEEQGSEKATEKQMLMDKEDDINESPILVVHESPVLQGSPNLLENEGQLLGNGGDQLRNAVDENRVPAVHKSMVGGHDSLGLQIADFDSPVLFTREETHLVDDHAPERIHQMDDHVGDVSDGDVTREELANIEDPTEGAGTQEHDGDDIENGI